MSIVGLLAVSKDAQKKILQDPTYLAGMVLLLVLMFAGYGAIVWLRRWRQRFEQEEPSDAPSLEEYRKLVEEGELSQEEFDQIEQRLRKPTQTEKEEPTSGTAPTMTRPPDESSAQQ